MMGWALGLHTESAYTALAVQISGCEINGAQMSPLPKQPVLNLCSGSKQQDFSVDRQRSDEGVQGQGRLCE